MMYGQVSSVNYNVDVRCVFFTGSVVAYWHLYWHPLICDSLVLFV